MGQVALLYCACKLYSILESMVNESVSELQHFVVPNLIHQLTDLISYTILPGDLNLVGQEFKSQNSSPKDKSCVRSIWDGSQ